MRPFKFVKVYKENRNADKTFIVILFLTVILKLLHNF